MTGAGLQRFVLIGCGEAGSILGQDLTAAGRDVAIYDILLNSPATRGPLAG
jgi:prephenate dehydrogenase